MNDTLEPNEPHPSFSSALTYLNSFNLDKLLMYLSAFSSCAIEGNRLGEICAGTLDRFLKKEPISDRYLLGLVWAIKEIQEKEE
jgi:hypothetical protein